MNFEQLETLVEKAHGHSKFAKALWKSGFCDTGQTPTIMDVPSPLWCFLNFEHFSATHNTKVANRKLGRLSDPQIRSSIN